MKRNMRTAFIISILSVVLSLISVGAQATIITFDPLSGPNGTPYTGHSEGGFDVTPLSGVWYQAFNVGNPTPSIFNFTSDASSASLRVTNASSLFTFGAVDLGTGGTGSYNYTIAGYLANSQVLLTSGVFSGSTFSTIASPNLSTSLDRLEISLSNINITSFNVDNISVNAATAPVPEPASLALFGLGLAGVGVVAARKKRGQA